MHKQNGEHLDCWNQLTIIDYNTLIINTYFDISSDAMLRYVVF